MINSINSGVSIYNGSGVRAASISSNTFASLMQTTVSAASNSSDSSVSISPQAVAKGAYPSATPMATITVEVGGKTKKMQIDDNFFDPASYKAGDPTAWMDADTVSSLQAYVGDRMNRFLAANGVPEAPSKISFSQYDNSIQIPSDYKYADQLREALANDKGMSRALQETNALSSQHAYYAQFDPLTAAWAGARSDSEMDAITKRFSYLYNSPAQAPALEFLFGSNGSFSVSANGQSFGDYVREAQKAKA